MKVQYFKFTTPDGRAFYLLNADKAQRSAAKCNGTYCGPVPLNEAMQCFRDAMASIGK